MLKDAADPGEISFDEMERLLDLSLAVKSVGELSALTRDLDVPLPRPVPEAPRVMRRRA